MGFALAAYFALGWGGFRAKSRRENLLAILKSLGNFFNDYH